MKLHDLAPPENAEASLLWRRLEAMSAEILAAPEIFRPSTLWEHLNALNADQLSRHGFTNFKRTVNQNYFNFLPKTFSDNQVRNLLRSMVRGGPTVRPFLSKMERPELLEGFAHDRTLDTRWRRLVYRTFVALLWDHAVAGDRLGILKSLEEPTLGNPLRIRYRGRLVSQDLANSAREINHALEGVEGIESRGSPGPIVAELGAGYGRVGYAIAAATRCRYWVFDIPPALLLSEWYLTTTLPGRRIFHFRPFRDYQEVETELAAADLAFFSANQIALLPDRCVDAFLSISSLQEMRPPQIHNYLSHMSRLTRQRIYLKQWIESNNTADGVVIPRSEYRVPGPWRVAYDRTDEVHDHFFELALNREGAGTP